jgi:hypothetical protein
MIRVSSSSGPTGFKVTFSPRPGTVRGAKEAERDLLYAFHCEFCRNLIALAFLTEEKLTLGRYEESLVVSADREIREVIPNHESKYTSAYEIEWVPVSGKTMGVERIFMKNHVLRAKRIGDRDPFEPGARCCPYTSVMSLRKDLLIKDAILVAGFRAGDIEQYQLPSWDEFVAMVQGDPCLSFIHAVGTAPPIVRFLMDWIKDGESRSHWDKKLVRLPKEKNEADES